MNGSVSAGSHGGAIAGGIFIASLFGALVVYYFFFYKPAQAKAAATGATPSPVAPPPPVPGNAPPVPENVDLEASDTAVTTNPMQQS